MFGRKIFFGKSFFSKKFWKKIFFGKIFSLVFSSGGVPYCPTSGRGGYFIDKTFLFGFCYVWGEDSRKNDDSFEKKSSQLTSGKRETKCEQNSDKKNYRSYESAPVRISPATSEIRQNGTYYVPREVKRLRSKEKTR